MRHVADLAALPFLVAVPTPLAEKQHWGVTAIAHLERKAISFEVALPEEIREREVKVAGFTPGEVVVVEMDGVARDLAADENGIVTLAVTASARTKVAMRAKQ
jgi:hypothetical protein